MLVRWSPLSPSREMNSLVRDFFGADPFRGPFLSPATDVHEEEKAYVVKTEVPGLTVEDIKIAVEGDQLVISGEKRREVEKKDTTYHHTERSYGSFERRLTLTEKVDRETIDASYRDGVLTVRVPKAEVAKPREITIKVEK
jgi:HSP20 family protein